MLLVLNADIRLSLQGTVVMTTQITSIYHQVIEKTKSLTFRTFVHVSLYQFTPRNPWSCRTVLQDNVQRPAQAQAQATEPEARGKRAQPKSM